MELIVTGSKLFDEFQANKEAVHCYKRQQKDFQGKIFDT